MNILDISVILILIMFFIVGFKRGVIKEAFSLVGIILVFIISFSLKGVLGNILCRYLPFIPFRGSIEGITTLNILFYQVIAFLIIFCLLLVFYEILLKISKWLQKIVNMTIILIIPSKILGGILSFIKGYIIIFVISIILMVPFSNNSLFKDSTIINFMLDKTPILSNSTNSLTSSVDEIYKLVKEVSKKKITKKEANEKTIKILLKYKIVDKKLVEELIRQNKLELKKI